MVSQGKNSVTIPSVFGAYFVQWMSHLLLPLFLVVMVALSVCLFVISHSIHRELLDSDQEALSGRDELEVPGDGENGRACSPVSLSHVQTRTYRRKRLQARCDALTRLYPIR